MYEYYSEVVIRRHVYIYIYFCAMSRVSDISQGIDKYGVALIMVAY